MIKTKLKTTLLTLLLCLGLKVAVVAQTLSINQDSKISEIVIEGLDIIEDTFLLSIIESSEGGALNPRLISEDIRSIYKLGFAEDVSANIEDKGDNNFLVKFIVIEKPRVNRVIFKSNRFISDEALQKLVKVKTFAVLNSDQLKKDLRKIESEYKQKRFYNIKVFYEIIEAGAGLVDVVFNIIESPKAFITDINFTGNKHFYSLRLQRLLISQKINCFGWLTDDGTFDERRINADLGTIYQAYANEGFIKLKINMPRVKIISNKEVSKVIVDFSLEEGARYKVNEVDVSPIFGETLLVEKDEITKGFKLKKGEYFDRSLFLVDRSFLDNFYRDRGYAYTNINISTPINEEDKTVDIFYEVEHKQKVYINRINIQGNSNTRDHVVRRELSIQDGQLLRSSRVDESRTNLLSLGFFEAQTGVTFKQNQNLDKTIDYDITLKEGLTGSLNASLTYSGKSFGGLIKASKNNFLGQGQKISIEGSYADTNEYKIQALFSEPYFLDSIISSDSSISFSKEQSLDSFGNKNFALQKFGIGQNFGQKIWKNWKVYYGIATEWRDYKELTPNGLELLNFYTVREKYGLSFDIVHSSLNHPLLSSRGVYASLGYDTFGRFLGGDKFDAISTNLQYFKNLDDKDNFIFMARHRFRLLIKTDSSKPIPPSERIAIGGPLTIRGFEYGAINGASSPADRAEDFDADELKQNNPDSYRDYKLHENGSLLSLFNFEVLFPLSVDNPYLKGVVFYDIGNVWSEPDTYKITGANLNYFKYKQSFGTGVRIITPIGVIRLEYAIVINPKPRELPNKFEFFVGALF